MWGVPGVMLSLKGINAYAQQPLKDLWWLLLITACVVVMFYVIFRSVVGKYSRHISAYAGGGTSNYCFHRICSFLV